MSFIAGQRVLSATGGTISTITGYTVHTFTTSGNFIPTANGTIEVLVVGGGGGAASATPVPTASGGGGGGAVIYNRLATVTSDTSYPIVVGSVGSPGVAGVNARGGNGGSSSVIFDNVNITAFGGGGGTGPLVNTGPPGSSPNASGGGGGSSPSPSPNNLGGTGAGVTGFGFPGGQGSPSLGGGGGGAGRAGGVAGNYPSATGGIGVSYSITGISSFYGAGSGSGPGNLITGPFPNGGPVTRSLASFGRGITPGAVIIRYPT